MRVAFGMSSNGRGGGPVGASAGESVTTSVDEEWVEASAAARAVENDVDVRAVTSKDASSSSSQDGIAPSAVALVDPTSPTTPTTPKFKCKKCENNKSCWPVHVATQKLSRLRKKALGRRGGSRTLGDCDVIWNELDLLVEDGHRPTVKTYTALAAALGECGAPEECENILGRMREADLEPDVQAYNVCIHAWCVADEPIQARRLVKEMIEAGIAPVAATYPPLVSALARIGGHSEEIEQIISMVETISTNQNTNEKDILMVYEKIYHAFILGLLAVDSPEDAEGVLKRWNLEKYDMERVADRKGRISRPVAASYGMVIDHYVRDGRMGDARRLLNQMQWDKVVPSIDIFNMLLRGYLSLGNVGAAQDVFRELEGSGTWDMESLGIAPDVASYTSLMDHWANQGDVVLAEKVLEKMVNKSVSPDERAFGSLIKAYARARDPKGAEEVLIRIRTFDAPPENISKNEKNIGRGKKSKNASAASGGKFHPKNPTAKTLSNESAAEPVAKYVGPKDEKKKMKPGVVLWTTVVSAYAAVGDMGNARRVVEEMLACPKSWCAAPNDRTFGHLVWGYGQVGDVAGITATTKMIAEAGVSLRPGSEARKSLVRACRECGLPAQHVDRMVENLGELVKLPRRRKTEGWVSSKKKSKEASEAGGASKAAVPSKPEKSSVAKENPGATVKPPSIPSTAKRTPSRSANQYGVNRSGDAGWVCSLGHKTSAHRSVRVVANTSSRVPVSIRGLGARHGVKGFKIVGAIVAPKALFA